MTKCSCQMATFIMVIEGWDLHLFGSMFTISYIVGISVFLRIGTSG